MEIASRVRYESWAREDKSQVKNRWGSPTNARYDWHPSLGQEWDISESRGMIRQPQVETHA